jgi:hypothetical protein
MEINKVEKVLEKLPMQKLRERFAQCYGHTPTTRNRAHLVKKILWAIQRDLLGDISEATRRKALIIADDRDVKGRFPNLQRLNAEETKKPTLTLGYQPEGPVLLPGTLLHRKYRGENIRVLILKNGFEWNGEFYKSLSATARAITGTRWNGKLFFGLKKGAKQ